MNFNMNKYVLCILALFVCSNQVFSQAPNKISYQAIIRNSLGTLVTNQSVGMRISILQGGSTGSPVYTETHQPVTNSNGLVTLEIGTGTIFFGNFANIDWSNGPYFISTETDPTGGTNYSILGVSQLLSVPYALHANIADSVLNLNLPALKFSKKKDTISINDNTIILNDDDSLNELQNLKISNDSIYLSKNGGAILLKDNNSNNELQTLKMFNDTLVLSHNGGEVVLRDLDSLNEIQFLEKRKDSIFLSRTQKPIILNDDDSLNELQSIYISGDTIRLTNSKEYVILYNNVKPKLIEAFAQDPDEIIPTKEINIKYAGLTKRNSPWTVNAIYNLSAAWEPYTSDPFSYSWDVFFERNDSVFFFENGQNSDVISSYYFDKSNVNWGGPTYDYYSKSNLSQEMDTRFQTLGADKKGKKFFWINKNGLNIYDPFTNDLKITATVFPNSTNLTWLSTLTPSSTSLTYLNMIDSNLFVFIREINNNIVFYKYNYVTDKKTKIWDTKIDASKFGFPNQSQTLYRNNGYAYTTRGSVLFNDSIFVIPFNGKDNYGIEVNNQRKFGYLIFDYTNKKLDTMFTDLNDNVAMGFPNKKYLILTKSDVLVDLKNKTVTKLKFNEPRYSLGMGWMFKFPFLEKLYFLPIKYIQKSGNCKNSISCYPDDYNYPYFILEY